MNSKVLFQCFLLLFTNEYLCYEFPSIDLTTCGITKTCLKSTANCEVGRCEYAATWVKVDDYLEVELLGNVETSLGFVAIGFSSDKALGDDSLVACFLEGNEIRVRPAYVTMTNKAEFIQSPPDDFIKRVGTSFGRYEASTTRVYCRFQRKLTPKSENLLDLWGKSYHVYIVRGPSPDTVGFANHFQESLFFTSDSIKLDSKVRLEPGALAKLHGCLMVLAWVLFSSIGILMARYFKDMWPSYGFRDEQIWFHIHRACQITCWFLVLLGIIIIFIFVDGYSHHLSWPHSLHPILGIIIFILTFINPFLTLCRCEPRHPDRPWFNWIHFFVGTIAYVLAVPTMMLGFRMERAGTQLASLNYPMVILILFVIFQVVTELTLEIHDASYYRRNQELRMKYEVQLEDYNMRLNQGIPQVPPKTPQPSGRQFKYFMGGLHATVCIICASALVIAIIVN